MLRSGQRQQAEANQFFPEQIRERGGLVSGVSTHKKWRSEAIM